MVDVKGIVGELARSRVVEEIVRNVARRELDDDLKDLCQMVYAIILGTPPERLKDLDESGAMRFYVARIICTQLRSRHSEFFRTFAKYRERAVELNLNAGDESGAE